jgi:DNA mismatch repair protein MutS2
MSYAFKALEFDVVLTRISKYAMCQTTIQNILNLTPLDDLESVQTEIQKTKQTLDLIARMGSFPLIEDYDIDDLFNALTIGQVLSIKDILSVRLFMVMTKDVIHVFKEIIRNKMNFDDIKFIYERLFPTEHLVSLIDSKIDPDGIVLDNASEALATIRKQQRRLELQRREILNSLLQKRASQLNDQMIVMRNNRYCLPVKAEYKNTFKGIIHDESSSGTTAFIEPIETIEKTVELERLIFAEQQEIIKILEEISVELKVDVEELKGNLDALLILDLLQSKAKYALEIDGYAVQMNDQGLIRLVDARHPLIDPKIVVPISLELNEIKRTILISGPNTGGKTVALKTTGLLTLMAQSGLLVPMKSEGVLSIFKGVYADIGDEQSILQSLSTFSSHMRKIKHIVDVASDHILVLLDELGSGTDPQEGSALAMGILDYLEPYNLRMIVTTHYSELKVYAYTHPHIANASVAFDIDTLKPLYRINYGISGSSNALYIAKKLGLSEDVIRLAQGYSSLKENDLTKSIKAFEDESLIVKQKEAELSKTLLDIQTLKRDYEAKLNTLEAEKDAILAKTKAQADKQMKANLEKAQELIEILSMKELKDHEIAQIKYEFKQLDFDDIPKELNRELKVGDHVFIKSYDQNGVITQQIKKQFKVKFGMFELMFDAKDLKPTEEPTIRPRTIKSKTVETKPVVSDVKMELDLRGYRFEDVKDELDKFLDNAVLNHMRTVRIIHGFGTGAVRKAVYDVIKSSPYVNGYRYGGEGEGLNGVTIITLK